MRHHLFPGTITCRPPRRPGLPARVDLVPVPPREPPEFDSTGDCGSVVELRALIGWIRQRLAGRHLVRASVIGVELTANGSWLLMLAEADPASTAEPSQMKARLNPAELSAIREEQGAIFDPRALLDRIVVLELRTSMRQRFGKGAGLQANVTALRAVEAPRIEPVLMRERSLQALRLAGLPFGPRHWSEPEDPREIAVIASEHGDARRDVTHQLEALEEVGLLQIHWIWAAFEGTGAQASLVAALERAAGMHAAEGLSATLLVRGGGSPFAFEALNTPAVARAATAERIPNLIVGLGHAGTPRTALDEVAARSEPTPTAAARLVRDLVEETGLRAARALADLDDTVARDLVEAGRIALARAIKAFEAAIQDLHDEAQVRLRHLDRDVERALLGALRTAAPQLAPGGSAIPARTGVIEFAGDDPDPDLDGNLALVIDAATGNVITGACEASVGSRLLLQFPDGLVPVRVEPHPFSDTH